MATILDREATIKTAVVEIKALTVSGKQVTQALFRQLQEKNLINEGTLELSGQPWGRVNYHVHCDYCGPHLHIVWQEGAELRRSCVREHRGQELANIRRADADRWLYAAALHRMHDVEPLLDGIPASEWNYTGRCQGQLTVERMTVYERGGDFSVINSYWSKVKNGGDGSFHYERIASDWKRCRVVPNDWQDYHWQTCLEFFREERQMVDRITTGWPELYRELESLDQLFIAV